MKATRTRAAADGRDMKLKKLKAARAKWLEKQQATRSDYARQEATRRFVIFVDGSCTARRPITTRRCMSSGCSRRWPEERHRRSADGQPGDVASIGTAINCKFRLPGTAKL